MHCTRCQGLMLVEHMIDMEAGYGEMWSRSYRCFNCGHREDAVIPQHRLTRARAMAVSSQTVLVPDTVELSWESEEGESLAA